MRLAAMNRHKMFFVHTNSNHAPNIYQTWNIYMQGNQLMARSSVELKGDSIDTIIHTMIVCTSR